MLDGTLNGDANGIVVVLVIALAVTLGARGVRENEAQTSTGEKDSTRSDDWLH